MTQAIEIGNTQPVEIVNTAVPMSPHDEFVGKIDYTVDCARRVLLQLQKP